MIPMFVFCGIMIVVALVANRMLTAWYVQSVKAIRQEDAALRARLDRAAREQKKLLIELRRVKSLVTNYESEVDNIGLE